MQSRDSEDSHGTHGRISSALKRSVSRAAMLVLVPVMIVFPLFKSCRTHQDTYFKFFVQANYFYAPGIVYGFARGGDSWIETDLRPGIELERFKLQKNDPHLPRTHFHGLSSLPIKFQFLSNAYDKMVLAVGPRRARELADGADVALADFELSKAREWQVVSYLNSAPSGKLLSSDGELYVITDTVSAAEMTIDFPTENSLEIEHIVRSLSSESDQVQMQSRKSIRIVFKQPIEVAFKAVPMLRARNALRTEVIPVRVPTSFIPQAQAQGGATPGTSGGGGGGITFRRHKDWRSFDFPVPGTNAYKLEATHYSPLSEVLPDYSAQHPPTYGAVLKEIQRTLAQAGIDEIRILNLNEGIGIATRMERTNAKGEPLARPNRFEIMPVHPGRPRSVANSGNRLRGFLFSVSAHKQPAPTLDAKDIEKYFLLQRGAPFLWQGSDERPITPAAHLDVYVFEYWGQPGNLRFIQPSNCGESAKSHLKQDRLWSDKITSNRKLEGFQEQPVEADALPH